MVTFVRRAALTLLAASALTVVVAASAYADPTASPSATSSLAAAAASDGTVSGTITDVTTGRPVDQAWVMLSSDAVPQGPSMVTSADGHYSLMAPAGAWRISVGASLPETLWTYVQRVVGGSTPESSAVAVDVSAGGVTVSDIALTPAGKISGAVVDATGHPVTAVQVVALDAHGNTWSSGLGITPKKDGSVTLWVLSPVRRDVRLCAWPVPAPAGGNPGTPFCSDPVSIAPEQVVTGVRVVVAASAPTPTPTANGTTGSSATCTTGCGGAKLAPTGARSAPRSATVGLIALLLGTGLVLRTRRRPAGKR